MVTLAIESANKSLSVALLKDNDVIASEQKENTLQHSIYLAPAVDAVLQRAQLTLRDIDQVAVSIGPGSYTGLRIGVTFAKVLAHAQCIPVLPVSSLYTLALSAPVVQEKDNTIVVPFYDARRHNVFVGYYQHGQSIREDEHLAFETVLKNVRDFDHVLFISPDITLYEDMIKQHLPNATCLHAYPDAKQMMRAKGVEKIAASELLPSYLKLAEAEENWQLSHGFVASNDLIERHQYK